MRLTMGRIKCGRPNKVEDEVESTHVPIIHCPLLLPIAIAIAIVGTVRHPLEVMFLAIHTSELMIGEIVRALVLAMKLRRANEHAFIFPYTFQIVYSVRVVCVIKGINFVLAFFSLSFFDFHLRLFLVVLFTPSACLVGWLTDCLPAFHQTAHFHFC